MAGQRDDLEAIGMARHDVERAGADRAGGAENGQALSRHCSRSSSSISAASGSVGGQAVDAIEHAAMAGQQAGCCP